MTAVLAVVGAVVTALLLVGQPEERLLRRRLEQRKPDPHGGRRRLLQAAGGVLLTASLTLAAGALGGPASAAVVLSGLVVVGTAGRLVLASVRRGRAARAQAEVAAACGVLASYLRVGQVTTEALVLAAQDCPVLAEAARAQQIGGDVAAAWQRQAGRPGRTGLSDLARAWRVAAVTGAPLSVSLEQVAAGLAADQTLRSVVAGELSAPRATGKVMAVLPALGVGLGYVLGGDPLSWLVAGPPGWACLVGGSLLAAAGVSWIERLARDAEVAA